MTALKGVDSVTREFAERLADEIHVLREIVQQGYGRAPMTSLPCGHHLSVCGLEDCLTCKAYSRAVGGADRAWTNIPITCGCHCAGGCCDPYAPCASPCNDHMCY